MKKRIRLEIYTGGGYFDKEIIYEGDTEKEIAKMIDKDQNDLLQYMMTGDEKGVKAFCFCGYMFRKEGIIAAQMSEPEY